MIGHPGEDVYVSAATAWEIATKTRIGKLKTPKALLQDFVEAIELFGFLPLPISLAAWLRCRPAVRRPPRPVRPHARGAGARRRSYVW